MTNFSYSNDNLQLAKAYLSLLCGSDNVAVTWQTFDDSDSKSKVLVDCWHDTVDGAWQRLKRLNINGAGVFVTVQETDGSGQRKEANVTAVRALIVDCDNGLPEQWHLEPTMVVESSPGKGHAYWVLREPVKLTKEEYSALTQRLIAFYGADVACKDLARVLRLPGTYNRKPAYLSDASEAPLVKLDVSSGERYTVAEVIEGIPEFTKPASKSKVNQPDTQTEATLVGASFSQTLSNFAAQLRQAKKGERNSTLNKLKFTLAGAFPNKLADIDEALTEAALDIGLSEAEIEATLASADKGTEKPITLVAGCKRSRGNQMRQELEEHFRDRLSWNEMSNELWWNGTSVSIEKLHDLCERELDRDYDFQKFTRIAVVYAEDHPYHPVRAYLQSLTPNPDALPVLSAFFQAIGVTNKLHRVYWKRFLLSAVARIMTPGCKADNALVLQGGQGIGKTTLFQDVFGKQFFQTVGEHKSQVDELLSMYNSWCCEYGEIEHAFSTKAQASVKAFLSKEDDLFRRPYAKANSRYPRTFVICGTTNQSEFLSDSTGNRRFWVCPIIQRVNRQEVQAMRDDLWSAILGLFLAGEQWELTEAEKLLSAEDTAQYEQENPWAQKIANYMTHHNPCTLSDIMENALGIDTSKLNDRKLQRDAKTALEQLKCTTANVRHNGVKGRYWFRSGSDYTKETPEVYEEATY